MATLGLAPLGLAPLGGRVAQAVAHSAQELHCIISSPLSDLLVYLEIMNSLSQSADVGEVVVLLHHMHLLQDPYTVSSVRRGELAEQRPEDHQKTEGSPSCCPLVHLNLSR